MESDEFDTDIRDEDLHLELINNISQMFQDLDSRHKETRKILDYLCLWIHKKFGELPSEITKLITPEPIPIPIAPKPNVTNHLTIVTVPEPLAVPQQNSIAPVPVTPKPEPSPVVSKPQSRAGPLCSKKFNKNPNVTTMTITIPAVTVPKSTVSESSESQIIQINEESDSNPEPDPSSRFYEESEPLEDEDDEEGETEDDEYYETLGDGEIIPPAARRCYPSTPFVPCGEDDEDETTEFYQPPQDEDDEEGEKDSEEGEKDSEEGEKDSEEGEQDSEDKDPDYDPMTENSQGTVPRHSPRVSPRAISPAKAKLDSDKQEKSKSPPIITPNPNQIPIPKKVNGTFACYFCPNNYKDRSGWLRHHWGHTGEKPYKCRAVGCDESFRHPTARKIHYHRVHVMSQVVRARAPNSGFRFAGATYVSTKSTTSTTAVNSPSVPKPDSDLASPVVVPPAAPVSLTDTPTVDTYPSKTKSPSPNRRKRKFGSPSRNRKRTRNSICPHCSKRFLNDTMLKYHIYSHTGEKPYVCQYCNLAYTQPGNLQRHIRSAHQNEELAAAHAAAFVEAHPENIQPEFMESEVYEAGHAIQLEDSDIFEIEEEIEDTSLHSTDDEDYE